MKVLSVAEGKRGRRALAIAAALSATIPIARANLIFTEHVSVNDLPNAADASASDPTSAATALALGDALTIRYEVSQPSDSASSDEDSVVYEQVQASVAFNGQTIYSSRNAELTVWNLIGFYGITIGPLSSPLVDFLASNSPDVLTNGFLTQSEPITAFDASAGGSVFIDGQVIGFQTVSYQFSGDLPLTPVPEPASYGVLAGLGLIVLVSAKQLRRSR